MRTIDADRLKRSFEANTPIAFQDCVPGIHAVIDLEPTVDAIQINWLKNQYMVASQSDSIEYIHMAMNHNKKIDEIIDLWRKEQAGDTKTQILDV